MSDNAFYMIKRTPVELETSKRARIALAAFAYELMDDPIMSDAEFDALATSIDLTISTTRPALDIWFICNFQPHTGQWIWAHPDLPGLERIYKNLKSR